MISAISSRSALSTRLTWMPERRPRPKRRGLPGPVFWDIAVDPKAMSRPIRIGVDGEVRELCRGDRTTFEIAARSVQTGHD